MYTYHVFYIASLANLEELQSLASHTSHGTCGACGARALLAMWLSGRYRSPNFQRQDVIIPCNLRSERPYTYGPLQLQPVTPMIYNWLVVSNIFYFPFHIWDVIRNIDFHSIIFQDGHIAAPTRSPAGSWRALLEVPLLRATGCA